VTPAASVADVTVKMASLAASRLAPAEYGSAKMKSRVRVFGPGALREFASLTQTSSDFSKSYFSVAVIAAAALMLVSVFF